MTRRYILFKADRGQMEIYRRATDTHVGECHYRVNNPSGIKSITRILAEHHDSSGKPAPAPGYRLTESVFVPEAVDSRYPKSATHFRDNGWEVTRVEEYTPQDEGEYDSICICYCAYKPLEVAPLKAYKRLSAQQTSIGERALAGS